LLGISLSLEFLLSDLNCLSSSLFLMDLETNATVTMWSCRTYVVPASKTDSICTLLQLCSQGTTLGGQVLQRNDNHMFLDYHIASIDYKFSYFTVKFQE
jgi:hypothetical protein